jgi:hypothetical protein
MSKNLLNNWPLWVFNIGPAAVLCAVVFGYTFLASCNAARAEEQTRTQALGTQALGLTDALEKIGLRMESSKPLTKSNLHLVSLQDGSKIVVYMTADAVFVGGGFDVKTGANIFGEAARENHALTPRQVLKLIGHKEIQSSGDASPTPLKTPDKAGDTAEKNGQKVFTQLDFKKILNGPGLVFDTTKPASEAKLIMFTWNDCYACTNLRKHFDKMRNKIKFQIFFLPIAGAPNTDRTALAYLGASGVSPEERRILLSQLWESSDILETHIGSLRVPAFAWLTEDGSVHIKNLDGPQFRTVLTTLNDGVDPTAD